MAEEPFADEDEEPDFDAEPPVEIDEHAADRYLRALRRIADRRRRAVTFATAEHERVSSWLARQNEPLEKSERWYVDALEAFARREIPKLHKSKTLDLPNGRVSLRAPSTVGRVELDMDSFAPWALDNPDHPAVFVVVEHRPDRNAIKDLTRVPIDGEPSAFRVVGPDGEVVPGVRVVVDTEESFGFKVVD